MKLDRSLASEKEICLKVFIFRLTLDIIDYISHLLLCVCGFQRIITMLVVMQSLFQLSLKHFYLKSKLCNQGKLGRELQRHIKRLKDASKLFLNFMKRFYHCITKEKVYRKHINNKIFPFCLWRNRIRLVLLRGQILWQDGYYFTRRVKVGVKIGHINYFNCIREHKKSSQVYLHDYVSPVTYESHWNDMWKIQKWKLSHSVMSDSLRPHGL